MSIKAHITPNVLKWARESAGYSVEEISEKLKLKTVKSETITAWEQGTQKPSYPQLKRLANIYKRPIAVFFFPEPPEEDIFKQRFRSLPVSYIRSLSPKIRYLVRSALARQIDLEEIHDGLIPEDIQNFRRKIENTNTENASLLAKQIRSILDVSIEEQFTWESSDEALKLWRRKLEENGIWVFKKAFADAEYCGFALHHEAFPIIYINSSESKERQIFTLFHELGHLLIADSGIDFRENIEFDDSDECKREENFCNAFAGEFLVPPDSLSEFIEFDDDTISRLAEKYKTSREVVLRRYLDKRLITSEFYNQKISEWRGTSIKTKGKGGGGNYYVNLGTYLGEKYPTILFKRYYQHKIDEYSLAEYLGIKPETLYTFEGYFLEGKG